MNRKPPKWCHRCSAVHGQHCPKKPKHNWDAKRQYGSSLGNRAWRKTREIIFTRDKFLCQMCLRSGRITPVELRGANHGVCDHIIPRSRTGSDEHSNLQTLCQACDHKKTRSDQLIPPTGGS